MTTKKKERTAADVLADPEQAESTKKQRLDYLNMPEVKRSLALEREDVKKTEKGATDHKSNQ